MSIMNTVRNPLNGIFELTARCNLRCKMCMIRMDDNVRSKERSTKEWVDMARQVKDAGTLSLLLTGGEPLFRSDFADIYTEIASMGFYLTVYTNATLITEEIHKLFQKYPPHNIGVTVYGASNEIYELVTGSGDAYDRMLVGMEKLKKLPSRLSIRTTIIKDNLKDLDRIMAWARSFGPNVDFNVSRIVNMPVRGGAASVKECRLSPEENVEMLKKIYAKSFIEPLIAFFKEHPDKNFEKNIENILSGRKEEEKKVSTNKPTLYGCNAGIDSYTITLDGKLIGCQMLNDCCTYPFDDGFQSAWEQFPKMVRLLPAPEECKGCSTPCSSCYATRQSETGSMDGWPEYICKEAKLKEKMEMDLVEMLYASLSES